MFLHGIWRSNRGDWQNSSAANGKFEANEKLDSGDWGTRRYFLLPGDSMPVCYASGTISLAGISGKHTQSVWGWWQVAGRNRDGTLLRLRRPPYPLGGFQSQSMKLWVLIEFFRWFLWFDLYLVRWWLSSCCVFAFWISLVGSGTKPGEYKILKFRHSWRKLNCKTILSQDRTLSNVKLHSTKMM